MKSGGVDSWKKEEDKLLVETLLNYVRHGKTQQQAFEDVGEQIDRTGAACGFRWNAILRKNFVEELKFARRERRGYKKLMKAL